MTPSPPPDASGTARGLMGLVAQTFAGIKTFTSTIVASAGIQVASLFNTNGTGASDVGVKVGVSTADASVNATAHILSARTGISGVEVEKFWVNKLGPAVPINGQFSLNGDGGGIFLVYRSADGMAGFSNGAAAYLGIFPGTGASGCSGGFTAVGGFTGPFFSVTGAITDITGTPGTTGTVNAAKGRAAITSASTTFTMTNSTVTANSVVLIEWEDDPGQRHRVVPSAGQFIVTLAAGAAANSKFRFFVVG